VLDLLKTVQIENPQAKYVQINEEILFYKVKRLQIQNIKSSL